MDNTLTTKVTAALSDESPEKWGKKNHTVNTLAKLVTEVESKQQPSLTQLIANDMKNLVVQEAYELAEGIVRVHHPDIKEEQLRTETIEMMLTLNKWCLTIK